jgi:hypothetical protein
VVWMMPAISLIATIASQSTTLRPQVASSTPSLAKESVPRTRVATEHRLFSKGLLTNWMLNTKWSQPVCQEPSPPPLRERKRMWWMAQSSRSQGSSTLNTNCQMPLTQNCSHTRRRRVLSAVSRQQPCHQPPQPAHSNLHTLRPTRRKPQHAERQWGWECRTRWANQPELVRRENQTWVLKPYN